MQIDSTKDGSLPSSRLSYIFDIDSICQMFPVATVALSNQRQVTSKPEPESGWDKVK